MKRDAAYLITRQTAGLADLFRQLDAVKGQIREGIDLQKAQETAKKGEIK